MADARAKVQVTDDWADYYAQKSGLPYKEFLAGLPFDVEIIEAWLGSPEEVTEHLTSTLADLATEVVFIPRETNYG